MESQKFNKTSRAERMSLYHTDLYHNRFAEYFAQYFRDIVVQNSMCYGVTPVACPHTRMQASECCHGDPGSILSYVTKKSTIDNVNILTLST